MRKLIIFLFATVLLAACSSINCPLNSYVYTTYSLAGDIVPLPDTLTISTRIKGGNDSILINRDVNIDGFNLPISYQNPVDTLFLKMVNADNIVSFDTIMVAKTNIPHFESVDCSPNFFHTITSVEYTKHRIDSVVINNSNVSYEAVDAHFLIYFTANAN